MKTFAKVAASCFVLAALFYFTDTALVFERLRGAHAGWLGLALASLTAQTFLMARRWQLTVHALSLPLDYPHAVREYYLAQLWNLILPGGIAGDAARAVRLRGDGDLVPAAQSVMMERLIGQSTLFGLMFVGFLVATLLPNGLEWPQNTWVGLVAAVLVAIGGWIYAQRAGSIARFLTMTFRLMFRPSQIVLSVTIALLILFGFYACAAATGTQLPPAAWFTMIPLILTAMLIPLSFAGWGWREGAAAALFPLVMAPASAGIAASIAYGGMLLIAALPAVALILLRPRSTIS